MSLTLLIRGHQSAVPSLSSSCFTQSNYGVRTNTTLSVNTPLGVLGGSVAAVSSGGGDYTSVPGTDTITPIGLFMNDVAGAAFDNSPAVASGKVTVIHGHASVEVDVYETRNAADSGDLTYAVGNKLYCSAQGLLTKESGSDATIIGVVTKAPTVSSPVIGLTMRI